MTTAVNATEVKHFVYVGQPLEEIPKDITHLTIDPSVSEIPNEICQEFHKLEEVICQEGLLTIGDLAFWFCNNLKYINIPSTVKHIGDHAFAGCPRLKLNNHLHEGLETIGRRAFYYCCSFRNFRLPSSVERIEDQTFECCRKMFSFEVSETIQAIGDRSFYKGCARLRNFAIPSSEIEIGESVFDDCSDLEKIFPKEDDLITALKRRFDGLPIHKICYFQSYHPTETSIENLKEVIESGGPFARQDCLGMTPSHILALSTKPNIELFRKIVEIFPDDLITQDKWGELPLDYACMVGAPVEIIQFLLESHKASFPDFQLDWQRMIFREKIGCTTPENARCLMETQKTHYPNQKVDFQEFLEGGDKKYMTPEDLQVLVDYQVEAFPDQALDRKKIIKTIMLLGASSENRVEMIRFLLETQKV